MSINLGEYEFTEPVLLTAWVPLERGGIFAVLKPDAAAAGRPFSPVFIGQADDLSRRDVLATHEKYHCWIARGAALDHLYVAVHLMPGAPAAEQTAVATALIHRYAPPCNGG